MRIFRRSALVVAMAVVAAVTAAPTASAQPARDTGVTCGLPESNAEALVILNNSTRRSTFGIIRN